MLSNHSLFLQSLRQGWIGDLTVGLLGLTVPLAFAPTGFYLLAVLSLCGLFLLWGNLTPGRAFQRGWMFGLGVFGYGMYWLYLTFHDYAAMSFGDSASLQIVLVTFMALFPAVLGFIANQFQSLSMASRFVLLLPAGWTLLEWVRSWMLVGLPWLSLGYSQIDSSLAGFSPLAGVYGVSWAVALSAGLMAMLILGDARRRWLSLIALLVVWGAGGLLWDVEWTRPSGDAVRVSLLQGNIPQRLKWRPEYQSKTLRHYRELARGQLDKDLVIWPETAIPIYRHEAEKYFLPELRQEATDSKTVHFVGMPVYDSYDGRQFNSLLSIGAETGLYHKQHLVPFGEFIPLRWAFEPLLRFLDYKKGDYSPGPDSQPLLRVSDYPVGTSICFEAAFGEEVISDLPDAAWLVNVTNDAWFGDSSAPYQHLEIARMRALETGRYLLRSANTGISAIINPMGAVLSSAPLFQTRVLEGTVVPYEGSTPYVTLGNVPVLVGAVVASLLAITFTPGSRRD